MFSKKKLYAFITYGKPYFFYHQWSGLPEKRPPAPSPKLFAGMGVAWFTAFLVCLFFLVVLIALFLFLAKRKWKDKGNNGSSEETTASVNQAGPEFDSFEAPAEA